jgi:hypothetical protein
MIGQGGDCHPAAMDAVGQGFGREFPVAVAGMGMKIDLCLWAHGVLGKVTAT